MNVLKISLAALIAMASASAAHAFDIGKVLGSDGGGVIGNIIEEACGNCGAGRQLDRAHHDLENPIDRQLAPIVQGYGAPISPNCATPAGVFVGPWLPIGTPCNAYGHYGVTIQ